MNALHGSWKEFADSLAEADRSALRHRTLRKHAIETGIIERLYLVDWGVTETLVADGLTREAMARAGGDPEVLPMLQAQMEGLEMVTEYVRDDRPLTTSFVKELHALITRTQLFYDATDALGRSVRTKLEHGKYKTLANNVRLADGSLYMFAPPEQVSGEIERLIEWYRGMDHIHPVVSASWLHHRFVQIHPFQDGNGRVARALTLFSLEKNKFPPIVVDRENRDSYLEALDQADHGDLTPLGRLFAKLAMRSIRRELEEPIPKPAPQTAIEFARAFAQSLDRREYEETRQKERAIHIRANQLHARMKDWMEGVGEGLDEAFASEGRKVEVWIDQATPDDGRRAKWWRFQIIETAKQAEHFADLSSSTWWAMLGVTVNGLRLRFITSIHHVGSRRTGVMAITSFGDVRMLDEEPAGYEDTFVATSWDAFTFAYNEEVEDRSGELYEWLDQSLTVALEALKRLTIGG
ncbi:MAG: Fic family protein [bacterium]|nr:Fic family protein [bacterium]